MKPRFIISGGGTGGHIYPAIAIADELKARFPDCEILFVGAKDKMEMQKVPQAGYRIEGLWISGIQRKISIQNAKFPFKLIDSLLKSRKIIKEFKPDVAIGTGGFASGAVVRVASQMGIPTLIQEQNSYPGITNKMLSKKAKTICVAYEGLDNYFAKDKMVFTGNPVREDITNDTNKQDALAHFGLNPNKKTLLVLGGSLGSRRINQLIEKEIDFFAKQDTQVLWQCGKFYFSEYEKYDNRDDIKVFAFIDRMDLVYAAADFIISRAGASSVSELAIVGKPVIFIPSPNVAEDHQTKNALAVSSKNGAILLKEKELDTQFENKFIDLIQSEEVQQQLSNNIKALAKPKATKDIVDQIVKLIKH
ncbi:MAG TPA: undecaprenyldiphospho-muramoylpentapeptide beta-N-acetylglucosaminyltransferase [Flavobacterium sp.]|nr:undecaprenyldiphospho-muramoylpentapeptide beta-N-acetylglucosaminyltransferase [Flavobacterium sp.]